jgi:chemotaxis receptor (MCP) glutamine deamidase CheD
VTPDNEACIRDLLKEQKRLAHLLDPDASGSPEAKTAAFKYAVTTHELCEELLEQLLFHELVSH